MESTFSSAAAGHTDICNYVTELQLHMALQSRNLVPSFGPADDNDSRMSLLHQAQAELERSASRQWF